MIINTKNTEEIVIKKILSLIISLVMVISSVPTAFAQAAKKDYETSWAKDEITYMMQKGILSGYPDGTFKPANNMKKSEFYRAINALMGFENKSKVEFDDVKSTDWYYGEVEKGLAANYLSASKSLNAKENITRQEVVRIIGIVFDVEEDEKAAEEFIDAKDLPKSLKGVIGGLKEKGYISGYPDGTFKAKTEITRAEVVKILYNISGQLINKAGIVNKDIKTNLLVNTADVVLKDMTIQGDLYLTEGIGEGNVTLDNVEVKGELSIRGGGPNSIIIKNSKINTVSVDKESGLIRIVFENTTVNEVRTSQEVKIELTNGTVIKLVELDGKIEVIVEEGSSVVTLDSVSNEITIDAKGTIQSIKSTEDILINGETIKANTETKIEEGKTTNKAPKTPDENTPSNTDGNSNSGGNSGGSSSGGSSTPSTVLVSGISITGDTTLINGQTLQLGVAITPSNASNKAVTWSITSGPGMIDTNGLLTATGVGTLVVKATAKDGSEKSDQVDIQITPSVDPEAAEKVAQAAITDKTVEVSFGKVTDKTTVLAAIKALSSENAILQALTVEALGEISGGKVTVTIKAGITAQVTITESSDPAIALANQAITAAIANVADLELAFGTNVTEANIVAKLPAVDGIEYTAVVKGEEGSTTWTVTVKDTGNKGTPQTKEIQVTVADQDQAAPEGLVGVAPTTVDGTVGKITGTTIEMEYKLASAEETAYVDCSATETEVAAGSYVVRLKAKEGFNAGAIAVVEVPAYVAPVTVNKVEIKTAPSKVTYTVGDELDLTGLVVTLTKTDTSTEDVGFEAFESKGITTDKENGASLVVADTEVAIRVNEKIAKQAITVNPIPVSDISIIGETTVGHTLTANPTPGQASGKYQWLIADAKDGEYLAITGATGKTYDITEADQGKFLQVKFTATDGYTGTQTSNPVGRIYVLAADEDFDGTVNDWFRYKGADKYVEIPHTIKGISVTNYRYMFDGKDVKGVKSSNKGITDMTSMFMRGTAIELDLSNLDTSGVTIMNQMFRESQATIIDLSSFNTSQVTSMESMFRESQATTLNLSAFDTSQVTNMSQMFYESKATTINLSAFDTSQVTDMSQMFHSSQATTGYARTQADADKFNASSNKPVALIFEAPAAPLDPVDPLVDTPVGATQVTKGETLAQSTLSGTFKNAEGVAVEGTLAWTTPATQVDETDLFEWTFTPTDQVNYKVITGSVTVVANEPPLPTEILRADIYADLETDTEFNSISISTQEEVKVTVTTSKLLAAGDKLKVTLTDTNNKTVTKEIDVVVDEQVERENVIENDVTLDATILTDGAITIEAWVIFSDASTISAIGTPAIKDTVAPTYESIIFNANGDSPETITITLTEAIKGSTGELEFADNESIKSWITLDPEDSGVTVIYKRDIDSLTQGNQPGILITSSGNGQITSAITVKMHHQIVDMVGNLFLPSEAQGVTQ